MPRKTRRTKTAERRERDRACARAHYRKYSDEYKTRNRRRAYFNREVVVAAKSNPCADCDRIYPPYVMDFDHVRGVKSFRIAEGAWTESTPRLLAEISKCDLVCANCHRERTYRRFAEARRAAKIS